MDTDFVYSGERVFPGTAPFHSYWIHARRYAFVAKWCGGKAVLDAGCGAGYGSGILQEESDRCVGLDRDPRAVKLARELFGRQGLDYLAGDILQPPLAGHTFFDVIVALEVFEHIPRNDIPSFFREMKSLLRPGGVFIVSVENRHESKQENPYHHSEMTLEEFRAVLTAHFNNVKIEYFGQDNWAGSYDLPRECKIKPIRDDQEYDTFIAAISFSPDV